MKLRFERVLAIFFLALLTVILLPAVVFYNYDLGFRKNALWTSHAQNVLKQAEEIGLVSRSILLESNNYLLTEQPQFLAAYHRSVKNVPERIRPLRKLISYSADCVRRTDSISFYNNKMIASSDSSIQLLSQGGLSRSELVEGFLRRKQYLDIITSHVAFIEQAQRELFYDRNADYEKGILFYNKVFLLYLILTVLLLVSSFLVIRFNLRRRKIAEERQRLSEEQLRLLINSVRDHAIFRLDPKGTVVSWNAGAENLMGYREREIVGRSFDVFYSPADRETSVPQKDLDAAVQQGHLEEENWCFRQDGSRFWANIYITATYDPQHKLTGFTIVVRDFSVRRQMDEDTTRALEKEKELNKMKSNFVALASHEFKSPLTSIQLAASALSRYTDDVRREDFLKKIKSNVKTLMTILEEFLSLEKIEEGKMAVNSHLFDIRQETQKICEEAQLNDSHPVIFSHAGEEMICMDAMIYKQIVTNLVSNAVKYSPDSTPVYVSTSVARPVVTVKVKDNGIGISAEDQKHLFERFFRASNVTGIPGTGLGLHLVKGYIDLLDGSIHIQSEPGKGTEITVTIKEPAL